MRNLQLRSLLRTLQAAGILAALASVLSSGAVAQPANDLCAAAEILALPAGGMVSASGSTTTATLDSAPFCGTSNTAPGVWYSVLGTGNVIAASTCNQANYDTKISVYTGSCGSLGCVAGRDDSPGCAGFTTELLFPSVAGTEYLILVHGFGAATGDFTLTLTDVPPPPNDDAVDAIPLTVNTPLVFDNIGATVQTGEPSPGPGTGASSCNSQDGWCSFETAVQNSVWFQFVAPAFPVTVGTVTRDLQIALWDVTDPSNYATFTEVAANDDGGPGLGPLIDPISLVPGTMYYVQVDGFNGATATADTILLSATCPCFDAAALSQPPLYGTCQALGPWSGGYTQYLGWPYFSGDAVTSYCRFTSPFAPDVTARTVPEQYQVCRQTLLDAAANAGVSCFIQ